MAYNMTFPEIVSFHNQSIMRNLVQNGPDTHPGARIIIRSDGNRVDLRFVEPSTLTRDAERPRNRRCLAQEVT